MKKYYVNALNTITKKFESVEVSKKVYDCFRRTQWNIRDNNYKHKKNSIPFSCLIGGEDGAYENFDEFIDENSNPAVTYEEKEVYLKLQEAFKALSEEEKRLIIEICINGKSEHEYSKVTGVLQQTINYQKSKILKKLKKMMKN